MAISFGKLKPWERGIAIRIGDKELYLRRQSLYGYRRKSNKWEFGVRLIGLGSDCTKEAKQAVAEL